MNPRNRALPGQPRHAPAASASMLRFQTPIDPANEAGRAGRTVHGAQSKDLEDAVEGGTTVVHSQHDARLVSSIVMTAHPLSVSSQRMFKAPS